MPFSVAYSNQILNVALAKSKTLEAYESVWIGLSSNDPEADNGAFTELSGNGYSRVLLSLRGSEYPNVISSAVNRNIKNPYQINWTKATGGDWAEAKGMGLFSAETGGTPFYYGALEEPVTCVAGAVMLFDPETFSIKFPSTDIVATAATSE